ncbi:putative membrane protein [Sediminibacillus halophilus]|uniref:Putative membrane protein n=2 Tax=Sediminibacillus halophilus TaxID=482461 RepID=A0A1G9Y969_9BACI|nr:putative membrane protein [Sediminibacillus halophilus]
MEMGPFISTFIYFIIAILVVLAGLAVFETLTRKYRDWEEIENGNAAVALSVSGKIIGICIVLSFAIYHSVSIWETVVWGVYGVVLQVVAYLVFEVLTRKFSVEVKLKENNTAVGIVSLAVSIGLAFVIGASIT